VADVTIRLHARIGDTLGLSTIFREVEWAKSALTGLGIMRLLPGMYGMGVRALPTRASSSLDEYRVRGYG
jgi:hypothetical protein